MGILARLFPKPSTRPGVYRIRNTITGCEYIGATTNPIHKRWYAHRSSLNKGRHSNRRLQSDWKEYGELAFSFEVLEVVRDERRVFERERHWQDKGFTVAGRYNPSNTRDAKAATPANPAIVLAPSEVRVARLIINHWPSTREERIQAGVSDGGIDYQRASEIYDALCGEPEPAVKYPTLMEGRRN